MSEKMSLEMSPCANKHSSLDDAMGIGDGNEISMRLWMPGSSSSLLSRLHFSLSIESVSSGPSSQSGSIWSNCGISTAAVCKSLLTAVAVRLVDGFQLYRLFCWTISIGCVESAPRFEHSTTNRGRPASVRLRLWLAILCLLDLPKIQTNQSNWLAGREWKLIAIGANSLSTWFIYRSAGYDGVSMRPFFPFTRTVTEPRFDWNQIEMKLTRWIDGPEPPNTFTYFLLDALKSNFVSSFVWFPSSVSVVYEMDAFVNESTVAAAAIETIIKLNKKENTAKWFWF